MWFNLNKEHAMNIVQNGSDIGLSGLASELKRTSDTTEKNGTVSNNEQRVALDKQQEAIKANQEIQKESETNQPLTPKQLEKVAQQLQDFVGDLNRNIEFSVDKDSGRDVIKVIDKDSGDLLKQYPSEEVLTLVSKLSDMVGGFVDAKA
jgi:flagellar protein FlaG